MSKTLLVEGLLATVDTAVQLTAQGSVAAPSRVVPAGVTMIKELIVDSASDGTADGAAIVIVELGGSAVLNGSQRIVAGAHGATAGQAGSDEQANHGARLHLKDVDIEVRAGDVINIGATMAGTDSGSIAVSVGIIWG